MENRGVERVTMAAFEAQAERSNRLVRWMILGWAASVIMLGWCIMVLASYEETVTTTSEVTQDSADYGNNIYAGGDMFYGNADDQDHDNYGEAQGTGDAVSGAAA